MSQALMVELIQTAHRPAAEISQMKKEVVDGVERATVAVLEFQRAKEAAISSGDRAPTLTLIKGPCLQLEFA